MEQGEQEQEGEYEWCYSLETTWVYSPFALCATVTVTAVHMLMNVGANAAQRLFLISQNQCSISNRLLTLVKFYSSSLLVQRTLSLERHRNRKIQATHIPTEKHETFQFWSKKVIAPEISTHSTLKSNDWMSVETFNVQIQYIFLSIFACNNIVYATHYTNLVSVSRTAAQICVNTNKKKHCKHTEATKKKNQQTTDRQNKSEVQFFQCKLKCCWRGNRSNKNRGERADEHSLVFHRLIFSFLINNRENGKSRVRRVFI